MPRKRPHPILWIWYAFGGRLPQRYRTWVLHDITCRTWVLRHILRGLVQMSPVFLVLLLPGELWIRLLACLLGVLVGYFYVLAYMLETTEQRLVKCGYPRGTGRDTRASARAEDDERCRALYNARYRSGE
ncbi:DUF5313 family protein [Solihabitans fulvus]|uniref:DUF5313 family protein n=1 Tax=Solihabitans fulvus TaxID=1892852 RepID=UPI001661995D|nr:DUF5313 family protein [Solihabitans fulvus]